MSTLLQFLEKKDSLLDFLQGLKESYATVRSQILFMDPLPTINRAYTLLLQEEQQCTIQDSRTVVPDPATMAALRLNDAGTSLSTGSSKPILYCTHCGRDGHLESKCFKKNGYPELWNDHNRHPNNDSGR